MTGRIALAVSVLAMAVAVLALVAATRDSDEAPEAPASETTASEAPFAEAQTARTADPQTDTTAAETVVTVPEPAPTSEAPDFDPPGTPVPSVSPPTGTTPTEGAALVEVPDVVGLGFGEADAQLRALGLEPEPSYQVNIEVPENTVFAQSPPAGQRIAEDDIVALTVSQGEIPRVPAVRGRNRVDAEQILRNAGFGVIVIEGPSQAEAGTVVFQEPTSGTELALGEAVTITVSTGPGQIFVPDVREQSPVDAIQTLYDLGFRVAERREPSNEVPEGEIIDTDPPHGFPVSAGLEVFIIISDGPPDGEGAES